MVYDKEETKLTARPIAMATAAIGLSGAALYINGPDNLDNKMQKEKPAHKIFIDNTDADKKVADHIEDFRSRQRASGEKPSYSDLVVKPHSAIER